MGGAGDVADRVGDRDDPGLGRSKLELLKNGVVIDDVDRACVTEAGTCTSPWSPSINYSLAGMSQGDSATFGLRAYDGARPRLEHVELDGPARLGGADGDAERRADQPGRSGQSP